MIIIATLIIGVLFACLEGYREATHFYYRLYSTKNDSRNEHNLFAIQRVIVWLPIEYMAYDNTNWLTWLNGVCIVATFIMWHDGVYYWKYDKLLPGTYPKRFWDMSTTSNSWWDNKGLTNPHLRVIYFAIGIIGLLIINLLK